VDSSETVRRAAVSAILRENDSRTEVLFIRRAERASDPWSGHMAFPGGRFDPRDPDVEQTAVRETLEEVGIDLRRDAELLGALDDVPAIVRGRAIGLVISPFVWRMERDVTLTLNHEVNEALWTPIDPLFRGDRATTIDYPWEGQTLHFPGYDVEGRVVWGLTYQMLLLFWDRVRGT
jgi:8-oxo-dGTP pyrophosphatase MutT (NUDIX family)